jgi:hypothetical protein
MRRMISGLVAAIAVVAASAVPAMACGGGWLEGSCSTCGEGYVPCARPEYVAPVYSGCGTCGGWVHERLPDPYQQYYPLQQYYYVNQGPTYTGPGDWAPRPVYRENGISGWYHHHHHYYGHFHHSYAHHYEHVLRRYY